MVVVYDRQLMLSEGGSGVLAGACAMSAVLSLLLYKSRMCRRANFPSSGLLLVSEVTLTLTLTLALTPTLTLTRTQTQTLTLALTLTLTLNPSPNPKPRLQPLRRSPWARRCS